MEYRQLGNSGFKVPVLSFGTATFGGSPDFKAWGSTDVAEAKTLINTCLDAGLNFFDTADIYSSGLSEVILGKALEGKHHQALIATKGTFPMGQGPNDCGSSRFHIISACEASLKRLGRDHIDLYIMHGQDNLTPAHETMRALDDLVTSGKVRYIGCSNYSGSHLMKTLNVSEKYGWSKFVAHQVYYSLLGRELEWELMGLGLEEGVGSMIWSPLAGGALTGKVRPGKPVPAGSRVGQIDFIPYQQDLLFKVLEVMDPIAQECDKTLSQVALNWLLQRPGVSNIVVGARNVDQLKQNLGAVGWNLTSEQVARLDAASSTPFPYPYWHQKSFPQLIPPVIPEVK